MDFSEWQQWKGAEVAAFICTFCALPQYRNAIKQNITGRSLLELAFAGMLNKGLTLAGICDVDHQRNIAEVVVLLMESAPEDLALEFDRLGGNVPRAPVKGSPPQPRPPAGRAPKKGRRVKVVVPPAGLPLPRVQTATEECLQEVRTDTDHESFNRLTPRLSEQWDSFAAHLRDDVEEELEAASASFGESIQRKLRLRERLGRTESEYVDMREADNPSALGTGIVFGLRAVQSLHARRAIDGVDGCSRSLATRLLR